MKVKIPNIEISERDAFQELVFFFVNLCEIRLDQSLRFEKEKACNHILLMDIARKMCLDLRNKAERTTGMRCNMAFSPSEAMVALEVCHDVYIPKNDYQKFVCRKISAAIQQYITNLTPTSHERQ